MLHYRPHIGYQSHYSPWQPIDRRLSEADEGLGNIPLRAQLPAYVRSLTTGRRGFKTIPGWPPPPVVGDVVLGFDDIGPHREGPPIEGGEYPDWSQCDIGDVCQILAQIFEFFKWDRVRHKRTIPAEWHWAPWRSSEFGYRIISQNPVAVSDGAGVPTVITTFTVPRGAIASITHIGVTPNNPIAWGFDATDRGSVILTIDGATERQIGPFTNEVLGGVSNPSRLTVPAVGRSEQVCSLILTDADALDTWRGIMIAHIIFGTGGGGEPGLAQVRQDAV